MKETVQVCRLAGDGRYASSGGYRRNVKVPTRKSGIANGQDDIPALLGKRTREGILLIGLGQVVSYAPWYVRLNEQLSITVGYADSVTSYSTQDG